MNGIILFHYTLRLMSRIEVCHHHNTEFRPKVGIGKHESQSYERCELRRRNEPPSKNAHSNYHIVSRKVRRNRSKLCPLQRRPKHAGVATFPAQFVTVVKYGFLICIIVRRNAHAISTSSICCLRLRRRRRSFSQSSGGLRPWPSSPASC